MEASTPAGSVGVVDGEELLGECAFCTVRDHSEQLLAGVDRVLRGAGLGLQDLDGIAVGLGPGSFTGLRVALSTAKGLAMALGIPLRGVPTLEALAHNVPFWSGVVCPMVDARRGRVYGGLFRGGPGHGLGRVGEDGIRHVASWVGSMEGPVLFLGSGAAAHRQTIDAVLGGQARFAPPELMHPRGAVVARLGRDGLLEGRAEDLDSLVPFYLKPLEAEEPCGRGDPPGA
jgi:tRNA threonylcarbamoyladenosine biosynthesis protein TsaB